jgi:hypothetical protein
MRFLKISSHDSNSQGPNWRVLAECVKNGLPTITTGTVVLATFVPTQPHTDTNSC